VKAVAENYPTLRATENFQQLSRNLSELEDEIQASRRIYNSNVQSYNTDIQQFPGSIIANQGGFTAREYFEIEDASERNAPQVSLSLFAPQYSMAAVIANEFTEADTALYLDALVEIGLVLFAITLCVNILSRVLIWSMKQSFKQSPTLALTPAEPEAGA